MKKVLNIETWMLLVVILLTACSDNSGGSSEEKEDCFLNIYVYAPGHPMLTRADVGEIAARSEAEHQVKTLQIWVFKHSDDSLVGYLDATPTFLNETDGHEMFRMKVSRAFADHPENVDVYVVANAESVGLTSLGVSTSRDELDAAKIGESSFGVGNGTFVENSVVSPVSAVPSTGLPMSGVEKDQPIYGSYPTLRIGSQDAMTTVQLTRAVSKLRFVLCRIASEDDKELVSIDGIQLDGEMIPTESFLMSGVHTYSNYEDDPIVYVNSANKLLKEDIPTVVDPMKYAYETQAAQDYEDMINEAIAGTSHANESDQPLMELGPTYLRESDKQLTGTIQYTVREKNASENAPQSTTTFSMAAPGDFYRNRSWIIYVFYMDAKIHVLTVTDMGVKSWTPDNVDDERDLYNW